MSSKKKHNFTSTKDLLLSHDFLADKVKSTKYVTKEFQDYGYRLAVKLDDLEHKSLYIKLAKTESRPVLDQALSYTLDYPKARKKAKIFMWKLRELRSEMKARKEAEKEDNLKLI